MQKKTRCWGGNDSLMIAYHDKEWGVPLHDDRRLFEFLVLDAFQAGLSWATILKKRENFRRAFNDFDPERIARYRTARIEKLMQDAGIVRNRMKIEAIIANAKAFLRIRKESGSFDGYIWGFVGGKTIQNSWRKLNQLPAKTPEAEVMSKALKKEGFHFVGPTICYAFMQAAGLVNDHLVSCFRYRQLRRKIR